ncbi:hypothetical protein SAMN06265371_101433 [Lutibacter agarilyticus]|uniref:DUF2059 domain-containing protein n=2 Tax=Lutibacter agarilyticus TaxID=1109740 RepID=A0A238VHP5_9FLAO|nr:hypothetical protein SAMN06265371_101433 [Lutibacter agarilyticus]
MKEILVIVVIVCFSFTVKAQDDAFTNDAAKLVEVISENAFKPYVAQFTAMIPAEKQAIFKEELIATFPELYNAMAVIYMDTFTHDEIKELLAFYATPVGKKLADKSGELAQKGMTAGQSWGMKVQEIMAKYK